MARYSAFLGRWVEVHYRAGDILMPASGTFVADSGKSIFLEQHLEQRGQNRQFRWEIPYQYIVRLEEPRLPAERLGDISVRPGQRRLHSMNRAAPRSPLLVRARSPLTCEDASGLRG